MADTLQPDSSSISAVSQRSRSLWTSYTSANTQLPTQCYCLQSLLASVPAFPSGTLAAGEHSSALKYYDSPYSLRIRGQSRWRTSTEDYDLSHKVLSFDMPCGFRTSLPCYFTTNSPFINWSSLQSERQAADGNHIGILALAWSYILSARWVVLQKPAARLYYSAHRAPVRQEEEDTLDRALEIAVHQRTGQSTRWWATLLASGQGWHAEINHDGKLYKSPWSAYIADSTYMLVRYTTDAKQAIADRTSEELPPSSREALGYLHNYCKQHSLSSQYTPALAAAMFFPWKNENSASAIQAILLHYRFEEIAAPCY